MAEKKRKKTRHTNLVVPGEKKTYKVVEKDRIGRTLPAKTASAKSETTSKKPQKNAATNTPIGQANTAASLANQHTEEVLPQNAIKLPVAQKPKKRRLSPAKRRRRKRRIGFLALVVLILGVFVFYSTGTYLTVATLVSDMFEGISIAARGGGGFPMPLALTGFVNAKPMGNNGFAVLGNSDFTMVSAGGSQLRSVHHGYLYPAISTAKTRAVIYNRGGKQLLVEGRSRNLATIATQHEILFSTLSPDGWLLVATSSRYTANIDVYGPDYNTADPLLHWAMNDTDGIPHMAAFNSDNRNFALGCLNTSGGALSTTLYFLRTDDTEPTAKIEAPGSILLKLNYLANHRVLAIYNTHAALYSQNGQEVASYSYNGRQLLGADIMQNNAALLFGSDTSGAASAVMLNGSLEVLFETSLTVNNSPAVLLVDNGLIVLSNQTVFAYNVEEGLVGTESFEPKAYGLVNGGQPLIVLAGSVQPLQHLYQPEPASSLSAQSEVSHYS